MKQYIAKKKDYFIVIKNISYGTYIIPKILKTKKKSRATTFTEDQIIPLYKLFGNIKLIEV